MIIEVNDRPLNLYQILYYYTRDEIIDESTTNYNIYYRLTDGRIITEEFTSEADRTAKIEEYLEDASLGGGLVQVNTYAELPDKGDVSFIYIVKDTGQTYYWDEATTTYIKTGTTGRTGVYSTQENLAMQIGDSVTLNKTDLTEIVSPTVDFMDGSDVIDTRFVHGIIASSDENTVTIKTVTDAVSRDFIQVDTEDNLPDISQTLENELYFIKDIKEFRVPDKTNNEFIKPNAGLKEIDLYQYYDSTNKKIDIKTLFNDVKAMYGITTTGTESIYLDPINVYISRIVYLDSSTQLEWASFGQLNIRYNYAGSGTKSLLNRWYLYCTIVANNQIYRLSCSDLGATEPTYSITKVIKDSTDCLIYSTSGDFLNSKPSVFQDFGIDFIDGITSGKRAYVIWSPKSINSTYITQPGIYYVYKQSGNTTSGKIAIFACTTLPSIGSDKSNSNIASYMYGADSLRWETSGTSYLNYSITTSGSTRTVTYTDSSYGVTADLEIHYLGTNTPYNTNNPSFYNPSHAAQPASKGYVDSLNSLNILGHAESILDLPQANPSSAPVVEPNLSTSTWDIFADDNFILSNFYKPTQKYYLGAYFRGSNTRISVGSDFMEVIDYVSFVKLSSGVYSKFVHLNASIDKPAYVCVPSGTPITPILDSTGTRGTSLPTYATSEITYPCWIILGETSGLSIETVTLGVVSNLPAIRFKEFPFPNAEFIWYDSSITKSIDTVYKTITLGDYTFADGFFIYKFPVGIYRVNRYYGTYTTGYPIPIGSIYSVGEENKLYKLTSSGWVKYNLNEPLPATTQQIQGLFTSNQGGGE